MVWSCLLPTWMLAAVVPRVRGHPIWCAPTTHLDDGRGVVVPRCHAPEHPAQVVVLVVEGVAAVMPQHLAGQHLRGAGEGRGDDDSKEVGGSCRKPLAGGSCRSNSPGGTCRGAKGGQGEGRSWVQRQGDAGGARWAALRHG